MIQLDPERLHHVADRIGDAVGFDLRGLVDNDVSGRRKASKLDRSPIPGRRRGSSEETVPVNFGLRRIRILNIGVVRSNQLPDGADCFSSETFSFDMIVEIGVTTE